MSTAGIDELWQHGCEEHDDLRVRGADQKALPGDPSTPGKASCRVRRSLCRPTNDPPGPGPGDGSASDLPLRWGGGAEGRGERTVKLSSVCVAAAMSALCCSDPSFSASAKRPMVLSRGVLRRPASSAATPVVLIPDRSASLSCVSPAASAVAAATRRRFPSLAPGPGTASSLSGVRGEPLLPAWLVPRRRNRSRLPVQIGPDRDADLVVATFDREERRARRGAIEQDSYPP